MDYRTKCLLTHGNECIICNVKEDIHAHHIDGNIKNNSIFNLVPLCASCHKLAHLHPESSIHDSISKHVYETKQFIKKFNTIKALTDKCIVDEVDKLDYQKKKIDSSGRLFLTTKLKNKNVNILRIDNLNSIQYIIEHEITNLTEEDSYKTGDILTHGGKTYKFIGGDANNLENWKQIDSNRIANKKEVYKGNGKINKNGCISIGRDNANKDTLYKIYEDDKFEYHVFKVLRSCYIVDLEQGKTPKAAAQETARLVIGKR